VSLEDTFLFVSFVAKTSDETMIYSLASLCSLAFLGQALSYKIGAGIYDVTGPSVQINFMGKQ
jgi:hypothetical protein